MRTAIKGVLLAAGLGLVLWSVRPLGMLAFGRRAQGVLTEVGDSTQSPQALGLRKPLRPYQYLKVKVPATYAFEVVPPPPPPGAARVTGTDTLYGKTRSPGIPMWMKGDRLGVLYLPGHPSINAAYQPRTMAAVGTFRLLGGAALLVWGLWFRVRKRVPTPVEREAAEHLIEA